MSGGAAPELVEERLDERTVVLIVRGDAEALDSRDVSERIASHEAARVILDLAASTRTEAGLGDALSAATSALSEQDRRFAVVSEDPDLRQALGLSAGETVLVAATRAEALERLG